MQFDECLGHAERHRRLTTVANAFEFINQLLPIDAARGEGCIQREPSDVDERTEHIRLEPRAFFVGKGSDDQRTSGRDARRVECANDFQATQYAQVAVVAAPGAHGVDVRAGHDGGQVFAARTHPEDVADRVDVHLQPGLTHPAGDQVAAVAVFIGQREAATCAILGHPQHCQSLEAFEQAPAIDANVPQAHPSTPAASVPTISR